MFQIGDSDIAPSFTVVERPNDWTKEIKKTSRIIIEKEVTFDNRATWSQQFDYIMDVCMKMKKAFKKYL